MQLLCIVGMLSCVPDHALKLPDAHLLLCSGGGRADMCTAVTCMLVLMCMRCSVAFAYDM